MINFFAQPGGVLDSIMEDCELLAKCRQGRNEDAFAQLVDRYSRLVYSVCMRTLNDQQSAEDASQAVFLVFAKRLAELKPDTVLPTWFYATARNCARDLKRSALRRSAHERMAKQMSAKATETESELWPHVRENLDAELDALPAPQREAIVLRFLSGMSESDAAREAGCPEKTLRTRVSRGLERLRERLGARQAISSLMLANLLTQHASEQIPTGLAQSISAVYAGKLALSAPAAAAAKAGLKGGFVLGKMALLAGIASVAAVATVAAIIQFSPRPTGGDQTPASPVVAPVTPVAPVAKWSRVGSFSGASYPLTLCIVPKSEKWPKTIYAGCRPTGVFKSVDDGKTWTACAKIPCTFDIGPNAGSLRCNPADPGSLYLGVESNGVFKSVDGGKSWTQSVAGLDGFARNAICFAFHPQVTDRIYVGTDNGIYRSEDGGVTWEREHDGLPEKPSPSFVALALDPTNADSVYGCCNTSAADEASGVYKRSGHAWAAVNTGLPEGVNDYGQQLKAGMCMAIDPQMPSVLYLGTASGELYKTTDGGGKWSKLKTHFAAQLRVKALLVDPQNSARVVAGLSDGAVFLSTDGGASWTALNEGLEIGLKGKSETINFQGKTVVAEHEAGSSAVKEFTFDPDTRTLYVARCDGLYQISLKH